MQVWGILQGVVGVQRRDTDPSFGGGIRSQGSLCAGVSVHYFKVEKRLSSAKREDHLSIGPIQLVRHRGYDFKHIWK